MSSSLIVSIVQILIGAVNSLVAIILAPIALLIHTLIPGADAFFAAIPTWLNYATTYVGWAIDAFGIPSIVITMVVLYYTFTLTSSLGVYGVKLAIKWYEALKP